MARGLRLSTRDKEKFRTFGRQLVFVWIQSRSGSAKAGRSRNRCFVSRKTGGSPSMIDPGALS
jgi:hypothetical protein